MVIGIGHGGKEHPKAVEIAPFNPLSPLPKSLSTQQKPAKNWKIFNSIGSVAANIGAMSYQYIPGVKTISGFIAGKTVGQLVPKKGALEKEIIERRKWLDETTKSTAPRELCRVLAEYGTQYLQHHICKGADMDASLRTFLTNSLLYDQTSSKANYGFYGDLLRTIIEKNPQVLNEILEANILKALCSICKRLEHLQATRPQFLIDFTKDLLVEYITSLQRVDEQQAPEVHRENREPPNHNPDLHKQKNNQDCFVSILTQAIIKLALPNGAYDLEFPISGKTYLTDTLFDLTATVVLPKIITYIYEQSTSNYVRDLFILKTFQGAHQLISTGMPAFESAAPHQGDPGKIPLPPYPQQNIFNTILAKFGNELLHFLDPALSDLTSFFDLEKFLTTNGTVFSQMLQRIEFLPSVADIVKFLLPLINTGKWTGEGTQLQFENTAFIFSTREEEEKVAAELVKQKQIEVQTEIRELMNTLASDFTGIGAIGAEKVVGKCTKEQIAEIMNRGSFFEQCKLCAHLFLIHIVTHILKFICFLFGQAKVRTASEQFYTKISSTSIPKVIKPFETLLMQNITVTVGL